jgi:hypothetical protein
MSASANAGTSPSTLKSSPKRNVVPNASATSEGLASASCSARMTARIAVPEACPMRCSRFICGAASGSWDRSSTAYTAAMAGMNEAPVPIPRTSSSVDSHQYGVVGDTRTSGTEETSMMVMPPSATRPPPMRSVSRPATMSASALPIPSGISSSPAANASSPRAI